MLARTLILLALAGSLVGFAGGPAAEEEKKPAAPILDTGLVETTEVPLLLFDVEARDKRGRPLRGLTRADFVVRIGGKVAEIYSVDDLCPCDADAETNRPPREMARDARGPSESTIRGPAGVIGRGGTVITPPRRSEPPVPGPVAPSVASTPSPAPPAERPLYVMHLDYSQLAQDGRHRAVEAAKRWIRETMAAGDRAMITAYATATGLRTLEEPTEDRAALLEAVARSYDAPELLDPFPVTRPAEIETCRMRCRASGATCETCWTTLARDEMRHGRAAFQAFRNLMIRLGEIPGRKALLYFHQNGTMFPARSFHRYYPVDEARVGDHVSLVEDLAAEANRARTAIFAAASGEADEALATNLGANLADYTGGGYNRGFTTLGSMVAVAARGCACLYRIGIPPPERDRGGVHALTVEVAGRRFPNAYRVRYLSPEERWERAAQAVLALPESATDLPIVAAIVPVAGRKSGWEIRLQVALDPDAVVLLPGAAGSSGRWEVGALLADARGRRHWEMLAVSELHRRGEGGRVISVLHERTIDEVRPGNYELRAFVRDRAAGVFGGTRASIELPRVERDAIAGPFLARGDGAFVRTTLPLRDAGPVETSIAREVERGPVPIGGAAAPSGVSLEFRSLLCYGDAPDSVAEALRWVSRSGEPLLRLADARIVRAGDCALVSDELDTAGLAPGSYAYHLRWTPGGRREPLEARAAFEIGPSAAARALGTHREGDTEPDPTIDSEVESGSDPRGDSRGQPQAADPDAGPDDPRER